MDFKDLFAALALVSIGLFAFMGLATDLNDSYGTTIGSEFSGEYSSLQTSITGNLSAQGSDTAASGFQEAGQGGGDADASLARRALRIMGQITNMMGMPGKLIQAGGAAIGLPAFITNLAQWAFNFAFVLTLAYIFVTGSRRLLGI